MVSADDFGAVVVGSKIFLVLELQKPMPSIGAVFLPSSVADVIFDVLDDLDIGTGLKTNDGEFVIGIRGITAPLVDPFAIVDLTWNDFDFNGGSLETDPGIGNEFGSQEVRSNITLASDDPPNPNLSDLVVHGEGSTNWGAIPNLQTAGKTYHGIVIEFDVGTIVVSDSTDDITITFDMTNPFGKTLFARGFILPVGAIP